MMKYLFTLFLLWCSSISAQVGIGTSDVDSSALLELKVTDKGILIPRMTRDERIAISLPTKGLLVFQKDFSTGFWYFNGINWQEFSSSGWSTTGDTGTDTTNNFAGTVDNSELSIVSNNIEVVRIDNSQNIGIGTANPQRLLHLSGTAPLLRIQDGNEVAGAALTSDDQGNATWQPLGSSLMDLDTDWSFLSGNSFSSPIRRTGATLIGRTGTTTHLFEVSNGAASGSTVGIGNEFIMDGINELIFSNSILVNPSEGSGGAATFGGTDAGFRWNTIYLTNGVVQTSDATLKTSIESLRYGIDDLMKLRPVSYYWKKERHRDTDIPPSQKEKKLGFVAQEVLSTIPEVVTTTTYVPENGENGTYVQKEIDLLGMTYEDLLPLLIKAKKEQHLRIQQLLKENEKIKQQLLNPKK